MSVVLKSPAELELMRQAGRINAQVRALLRAAVRPGVTGLDLDQIAREAMAERGGEPTFEGYTAHGQPPYPGAICFSVNEQLVHGIPTDRVLQEGDIVSIDLGVTYQGYVSDAAFTVAVGEVSEEVRELIRATEEALWAGIEAARVGNHLGDISYAIGARAEGYGIIDGYGGHGVGRNMHEEPHIPNKGRPGTGYKLKAGMVLALEPMLAIGHPATYEERDRWTVSMRDGNLSAHFEETVAITEGGPEILTRIDE
ncbi:MAG: type I methionyl aminopeptidase [Dehalococcoidia bacterium]|nr:type I methionyl aminopeptidase [Dehalococcoidia bacterium]